MGAGGVVEGLAALRSEAVERNVEADGELAEGFGSVTDAEDDGIPVGLRVREEEGGGGREEGERGEQESLHRAHPSRRGA